MTTVSSSPTSSRAWPEPVTPARAPAVTVALLALTLAGAVVVAVCAGLVSRQVWRPGGVLVPWGLALSIGGSVSFVGVARLAGRWMGFVAAGAWLFVVFGGLLSGPGGDYVVMEDFLGWGFLLAASAAVLVVAGWGSGGS